MSTNSQFKLTNIAATAMPKNNIAIILHQRNNIDFARLNI